MFRKHSEGQKAAEHGDRSDGAAGQPGAQPVLTQIRIETLGVIPRKKGFGVGPPMVSISAAAGRVAYAGASRDVYVYDVSDLDGSERRLEVDSTGLSGGMIGLSGGMIFSPSGRYLALPRSTAAVIGGTPAYRVNGVICDLETGKSQTLLSGRIPGLAGSHGAYGIVIDATDSLVAVADQDQGVHVRRLKDWGDPSVPLLQVLQKWDCGALAWSADGKTLYHAGWTRVGVLRCTSPSELSFEVAESMVIPAKKPLRGFGLRGLAVADEAGLLAVGGDKGADAIHVFDLATSTEVCHGVTPNAATPFLRFSGPGDHLLSVSTDDILRLWSVASGPEGRTMQLEGTHQFFGKIVAVDARPGSEFDILMVAVVKGAAEVYRVSLPIAG